jgi:Tol biopolymer transport system component
MNESMDRVLADWLREGPEQGPREGLERALAATRRVGQKPGWALLERWLPMQLTMARTPSLRPILAIVLVALLTLALVATALFIGSQRRQLPPPFGPASNGAIVFDEGGELFIADELSGNSRVLLAGPETDGWPAFSRQGDRIAFVRVGDGEFQVMSILPDGSGAKTLAELPGEFNGYGWSPTGDALLVNFSESGITGFRYAIVNADGSGYHELDLGRPADYGGWRPDGRHIVFRGQVDDDKAGIFIADADGTNIRQLPIESVDMVDFEGLGWSPDGKHLSFMSAGEVLGTKLRWQSAIADIDANGEMTALRPLRLDFDSNAERSPVWSPDSSRLALLIDQLPNRQVGIVNADGSGYQLVGPQTSASKNILSSTWAPDGKMLLITEFPDAEAQREAERRMWSIDVATGEATEVPNPVGSWQRNAQ